MRNAVLVGELRGLNADFLHAGLFVDTMLEPFGKHFRSHCGPFLLEFPRPPAGEEFQLGPSEFAQRLDAFLEHLPRDFRYAVELRQRAWLGTEYQRVLAKHGAAHVYNYWTAMPSLGQQAELLEPGQSSFVVVRLLLRQGSSYAARKEAFAPFRELQAPDFAMRAEAVAIARGGLARGREVFVLVNNKAEGSSPRTIEALAEMLVQGGGA